MPLRRLYLKGLPSDISEDQLETRLRAFGNVSDVSISRNIEGLCRGFGHATLDVEDSSFKKVLTSLNGSVWKGQKLHIENAKPDYKQRLEQEKASFVPDKTTGVKAKKRRLCRHSSDMTLVDEKNVDKRKGWRRGKFGRPIAILTLRKLDRSLIVMDPSHDTSALEKFYEGYRQRPLNKLTWFYNDQFPISLECYETSDDVMCADSFTDGDTQTNEPVTVETQPVEALAIAANKSWDQLVSGAGFSLSSMLNLPVVKEVTPEILHEVKPATIVVQQHAQYDLHQLFYNFSSIFSLPKSESELFVNQGSKLESITLWKAGRSDIRKDFKQQSKAAKRQQRKKHSLLRKK